MYYIKRDCLRIDYGPYVDNHKAHPIGISSAPQISAAGKTTSLGDFNTEEQAARAFDKALIHKDGHEARINFPIKEYKREFDYLRSKLPRDIPSDFPIVSKCLVHNVRLPQAD